MKLEPISMYTYDLMPWLMAKRCHLNKFQLFCDMK